MQTHERHCTRCSRHFVIGHDGPCGAFCTADGCPECTPAAYHGLRPVNASVDEGTLDALMSALTAKARGRVLPLEGKTLRLFADFLHQRYYHDSEDRCAALN